MRKIDFVIIAILLAISAFIVLTINKTKTTNGYSGSDTVWVNTIKIETVKYIPTVKNSVVWNTDTIYIDTNAVISDYYTSRTYDTTLVVDSTLSISISDSVALNRLMMQSVKYDYKRQTAYISKFTPTLFYGAGINTNVVPNIGIGYDTKKWIILGNVYADKTIGVSIYKKIVKRN